MRVQKIAGAAMIVTLAACGVEVSPEARTAGAESKPSALVKSEEPREYKEQITVGVVSLEMREAVYEGPQNRRNRPVSGFFHEMILDVDNKSGVDIGIVRGAVHVQNAFGENIGPTIAFFLHDIPAGFKGRVPYASVRTPSVWSPGPRLEGIIRETMAALSEDDPSASITTTIEYASDSGSFNQAPNDNADVRVIGHDLTPSMRAVQLGERYANDAAAFEITGSIDLENRDDKTIKAIRLKVQFLGPMQTDAVGITRDTVVEAVGPFPPGQTFQVDVAYGLLPATQAAAYINDFLKEMFTNDLTDSWRYYEAHPSSLGVTVTTEGYLQKPVDSRPVSTTCCTKRSASVSHGLRLCRGSVVL